MDNSASNPNPNTTHSDDFGRTPTTYPAAQNQSAPRPNTSPLPALLMDVLGVALFALFARIAHQSEDMPLNFGGWLQTLWPFLVGTAIGWVLLAVTGKIARAIAMGSGAIVWLCTAIAGLAIWGLRHGGVPHWSFIIVASVMSAILLLGWRAIAGMRNRRAAGGVKK